MDFKIKPAKESDLQDLVQLRIRAMKPSLLHLGRFDEKVASERLVKSFVPNCTFLVVEHNSLLGFFAHWFDQNLEKIFVQHLYVDPEFQGRGYGNQILEHLKEIACAKGVSLQLEALKKSPANHFYLKAGFLKIGESAYDNVYEWRAPISH